MTGKEFLKQVSEDIAAIERYNRVYNNTVFLSAERGIYADFDSDLPEFASYASIEDYVITLLDTAESICGVHTRSIDQHILDSSIPEVQTFLRLFCNFENLKAQFQRDSAIYRVGCAADNYRSLIGFHCNIVWSHNPMRHIAIRSAYANDVLITRVTYHL